jgi:RNA polymerase sigma-70 factor (family 1)
LREFSFIHETGFCICKKDVVPCAPKSIASFFLTFSFPNFKFPKAVLKRFDCMTEKDFERTYNSLWSKLYCVAYNYFRDKATAQEIVQDVFVNLWLKRDSIGEIHELEHYLLRSVKNKIYDQFDKIACQEKLRQQIALQVTEETDSTKEEIEYTETLELINEEIDRLPDTTKKIFRLSRFGQYTNEEIAGRLHLSGKAVEYHITRALKRLRLRLNEIIF